MHAQPCTCALDHAIPLPECDAALNSLCFYTHCCGDTTQLLDQAEPQTHLLACHTRRVSMSRLRFKGTLPPQLPCPPLCDVAASPFPPTSPRIIGSLSLSACPPLWRSPLCSRHETHSGCSVCEAELTEYPRSPDNPLVLKAHHRLMYPLHKHSDGLLTFSGLMRDSAHLRICAKGEYLHRAPFFYAVMWFFCNTRALVAIVISDVGHSVFLFQCYYFLPQEWDKVFKKKV